jgi:hypothetical protein
MNKITYTFLIVLMPSFLWAQSEILMADQMRADGKIYVVVAVLLIILLGLLFYLIRLDLRISGIEKKHPKQSLK